MAGESWQLAPEVVAEAAAAHAGERRRAAIIFGVGGGLLVSLLVALVALWEDHALHGDVGIALGVLGTITVTAFALAARATREMRRMKRVIAETGDREMRWALADYEIVASVQGSPRPELTIPVSPSMRDKLTEIPRATALRP
jgi:hypothetical protein